LKNKSELFERVDKNKIKIIITVNAAFIVTANTSRRFWDILNNNNVVFDGRIPYFTAKIFHRIGLIHLKSENRGNSTKFNFEVLSGSEIVYDFCDFAQKNNYRILFLGGKIENNNNAVNKMRKLYNVIIDGYSPKFENYPFSDQFNECCLKKIADFKPDILFVGFGSPKQEYWIDDHIAFLTKIGVKYAIGSGGTFDFISQKIKRAPVLIRKMGLEGLFRFLQEPNKMRFKRLIYSFKFLKYIRHEPDFARDKI
jgi:N-acetylglucosaminyldiphosphoundecaprenol N-acetyl-beta-D-mannosaminyltransferase